MPDIQELISYEPATGEELWRGAHGDVDEAVERARRAWPEWAAQPVARRIELMRRFSNEVLKGQDEFAELIARETGKPLWEAKTEVAGGDGEGRNFGQRLFGTHRAAQA